MDAESVQRGQWLTQDHTVKYKLVMELGLSPFSPVLSPISDAICAIVVCQQVICPIHERIQGRIYQISLRYHFCKRKNEFLSRIEVWSESCPVIAVISTTAFFMFETTWKQLKCPKRILVKHIVAHPYDVLSHSYLKWSYGIIAINMGKYSWMLYVKTGDYSGI